MVLRAPVGSPRSGGSTHPATHGASLGEEPEGSHSVLTCYLCELLSNIYSNYYNYYISLKKELKYQ